MWRLPVLLALCLSQSAADVTLQDQPIAASAGPTYLDGSAWTAASASLNLSVPATVPGDLLTDLQRAKVIGDPWLDITWLDNSSLWSDHVWTYATSFAVSDAVMAKTSTLLLTFDGVKMGATVRVNGHMVGVLRDQFLRYSFTIDPAEMGLLAGAGANRLDVTFGVDDVAEDGRFMGCTGGWDWAPFSYTTTNSSAKTTGPAPTLSKGVWKSVYLTDVPLATVAITHLTPHTRYNGAYPTARLADGDHGGFTVNVTAHLWAPAGGAKGSLGVAGSWAAAAPTTSNASASAAASSGAMTLPAGESIVSLQVAATAQQIKLWWPNGAGAQPLYDVKATWTPAAAEPVVGTAAGAAAAALVAVTSRHMGFRVFALVTVNDTNASVVASNASAQVNDTGEWCTDLLPGGKHDSHGGARGAAGRGGAPHPGQVSGRRRHEHPAGLGRRHLLPHRVLRRVRRVRRHGVPRHDVHQHRGRQAWPGGYLYTGSGAAAPDPQALAPPGDCVVGRQQRGPCEHVGAVWGFCLVCHDGGGSGRPVSRRVAVLAREGLVHRRAPAVPNAGLGLAARADDEGRRRVVDRRH